jgi:hypothetical protein
MLHKRDLEFTRDSEKIGDRKVSPVFGGVWRQTKDILLKYSEKNE